MLRNNLPTIGAAKDFFVVYSCCCIINSFCISRCYIAKWPNKHGYKVSLNFFRERGLFSFRNVMMFFGPIIGLSLGFDAINNEQKSGCLSVVLSQPVFRDSIINGKFIAGMFVLSLLVTSTVGIMVGVAIPFVGFGPTLAETSRIGAFTLLTILYLGFWLALSIFFSTFKTVAMSILSTVAVWIFFSFVLAILASLIAGVLVPIQYTQVAFTAENPSYISAYQPSSQGLPRQLDYAKQPPNHNTKRISTLPVQPSIPQTILNNLEADIVTCWPEATIIGVGVLICFMGAYLTFLRQEIRSTPG